MEDRKTLTNPADNNLLRVYGIYRVVICGLLASMYFLGLADNVLGSSLPRLFTLTIVTYTTFNFLTLFSLWRWQLGLNTFFIFFNLVIDVVATSLLMHASGGINSGLGFLLLINVAAAGIFIPGQLSVSIAAIAAICVLTQTLVTTLYSQFNDKQIFSAGIFGLLFFSTALVFQLFSRRINAAQQKAGEEARLANQLQRLNEAIVRRMHTGIIVIDQFDRIQLINAAATNLLGGPGPDLSMAPGDLISVNPALLEQLASWRESPWLRTPTFQPNPQSSTEVQANFATLHRREGEHILIFLEDIRTLTQHAEQMKLSSLGNLTGSIAHEVRNPLGAISHAAQLLAESSREDDIENRHLIDIIKRHSDRVNDIIENVLLLSRQKTPRLKKLWLSQWLERFVNEYRESHCKSGTIEIDKITPEPQVVFDSLHLSQILTNLLDNAIHHGRKAGEDPWIKLHPVRDVASGLLYLDIVDRGTGIPKEHLDKIFEPFFSTSQQGSGLGLYIARELCALNYASLVYVPEPPPGDERTGGYFRIGFAHEDRLMPRVEQSTPSGTQPANQPQLRDHALPDG